MGHWSWSPNQPNATTGCVEVDVALSDKERAKRARQAAAKLSPPANAVTMVQGSGHFRMTTAAWVVIGLFVAAFVYALSRGVVILPGLLLIFGLWSTIRPGRDLVVTDRGLAVFHRSSFNGRPSTLVVLLPLAPIYAASASGTAELELGPERVTLKRAEFDRLAVAMTSMHAAPVTAMTPPPAPATSTPMPPPAGDRDAVREDATAWRWATPADERGATGRDDAGAAWTWASPPDDHRR